MRKRGRRAAFLGVLALSLIACGSGSKAPATNSPSPSPSVSHTPKPTLAGPYTVRATPCVNFRKNPEPGVNILLCIPDGSTVQADGQIRKNAGFTWYHVTYKKQSGWIAGQYLQRAGASPSPSGT